MEFDDVPSTRIWDVPDHVDLHHCWRMVLLHLSAPLRKMLRLTRRVKFVGPGLHCGDAKDVTPTKDGLPQQQQTVVGKAICSAVEGIPIVLVPPSRCDLSARKTMHLPTKRA